MRLWAFFLLILDKRFQLFSRTNRRAKDARLSRRCSHGAGGHSGIEQKNKARYPVTKRTILKFMKTTFVSR